MDPTQDQGVETARSATAKDRGDLRDERRRLIREAVISHGYVRAADLVAEHAVSLMTIHRDLDHLQSQGWLRKTRGGATGMSSTHFHGTVAERGNAMAQTKQQLARAAARLLAPGQTVLLDDSTTCARMTRHLCEFNPLTVITNSLPVLQLLSKEQGIQLISLGGTYFPAYEAYMGLQTADNVERFRADVLFMSTTAVTKGRLYHTSPETVQVKRAMMAAAGRRVLVCDHTKFRRDGLYALAPLTDFDLLVVDDGLPPEEIRAIRGRGTDVLVVPRTA